MIEVINKMMNVGIQFNSLYYKSFKNIDYLVHVLFLFELPAPQAKKVVYISKEI